MVIIRRVVVGYLDSNCYIVGSEAAGEGLLVDAGDDPNSILRHVRELGLDIKVIALTHGHTDHAGGVREVRAATGAEVCFHPADSGYGWPGRRLEDGDSIDVGDLHFVTLYTPGHTRDGICFAGHGVVFTGDTLFKRSVGMTSFGGNHGQLLQSIHARLMTLPDDTVVYPGHGPETTIGAERRGNPFLRG